MTISLHGVCTALLLASLAPAQLVISEVLVDPIGPNPTNQLLEITNVSGAPFRPTGWQICLPFSYSTLPNIEIPTDGVVRCHIGAFGTSTVTDFYFPVFQFRGLGIADTAVLFRPTTPLFPEIDIIDFVSWGGGIRRIDQAVNVGQWSSLTDTVDLPSVEGHSIALIVDQTGPQAWIQEPKPSLGTLNLEGSFEFGTGCQGAGGVPAITSHRAVPRTNGLLSIDITSLPPNSLLDSPIGIIGFSNTLSGALPLPFDLGVIGLTGCTLYTSLDRTQTLTNNAGTSTWDITIPNDPSLFGFRFFMQVFSTDSSISPPDIPVVLSNAIEGRIGT